MSIWMRASLLALFTGAACAAIAAGCGSSNDETSSSGTGASSGAGASSASGPTASGGAGGDGGASAGTGGATYGNGGGVPTTTAACGDKIYQCGDLLDNDMDGLLDSQDPDCLGPCDNTEDSYYPNLPGMTGDECRVDCFWDNGNGPGNDDCHWDHQCDPLEVAPDFPPEKDCAYDPDAAKLGGVDCDEAFASQSDLCYQVCKPLTPNGCDCFGCCELPAGSGKFVWLQSYDDSGNGTCTIADVNDPAKCHPCTFVPGCGNPCDPCEVCIGKPTPDAGCTPGTGGAGGEGTGGAGTGGAPTGGQCPGGEQECGLPGQATCPSGYYCITGCCQQVPA